MKTKTFQMMVLTLVLNIPAFAQITINQDEAIQLAIKNNLMVKAGEFQVASQKAMKNAALDLGKTNILWMHGQFNSIIKDNNYTISQTLPFPTAIASQAKLASAHIAGAEAQLIMTKNELVKNVRSTYQQLIYSMAVHSELMAQDSLLFSFAKAAATRHRVGEGTLLEKSAADLRAKEVRNQLIQNEADISILKRQLQTLINSADEFVPSDAIGRLTPSLEAATADASPLLGILQQDVAIADRSKRVERNKLLPDIMVGYFTQSLIGFQRINNNDVFFDKNDRFTGFEFGVSFPLWFAPQLGKAKAAALNQESSLNKYQFFQKQIESDLQKAQLELAKYDNSLKFYEGDAIINAELILHQAQRAYAEGEIGYVELFQAINQARIIKLEYLKTLSQYNQASIELDYLIGKF